MDKEHFSNYLPQSSIEIIHNWVKGYPLKIRLAGDRNTKSGDFRPPDKTTAYNRISINRNLNPYTFLITFTHEFAHLLTWDLYKRKAKPHGNEWKETYHRLLLLLIEKNIFPPDIEYALIKCIVKNSEPVRKAEYNLHFTLSKYDTSVKSDLFLDELSYDSVFSIQNGYIFRKGNKMRTRYKCYCLNNKRWYFISQVMRVKPINKPSDEFI